MASVLLPALLPAEALKARQVPIPYRWNYGRYLDYDVNFDKKFMIALMAQELNSLF